MFVLDVTAATVVMGATAVAWRGLDRRRGNDRWWVVTTAGVTVCALTFAGESLWGTSPAPDVDPREVLYALGYGTVLVGLAGLARARAHTPRVSVALGLEATAAVCGVAVVIWLLVEPSLGAPGGVDVAAATAYTLGDVAAALFVAHLALSSLGTPDARRLLAFVALVWAGDTLWLAGGPDALAGSLYVATYVAFAWAASAPAHTRPAENRLADGTERLWTLVPAAVALPIALVISTATADPVPPAGALFACVAGGAMLARLGLLLHAHHERSEELSRLALFDPLTGLPNRRSLATRLEHTTEDDAALLFIDLDRFKAVNDEHGHIVGDTVLAVTGQRLRRCVRNEDLVYRFAGDEFVVICDDVGVGSGLDELVERIHRALRDPIAVDSAAVTIDASIGAVSIDGRHSAIELLDSADREMYGHKPRRVEIEPDRVPPELG